MRSESRPPTVIILLALVVVTGLGAIPAGIGLVADPTGTHLGLTPDILQRGPFHDFLLPGLFLLVVLGLGAIPVARSLWTARAQAATAALIYGLVLLAWITLQALVIGILSPLQPVYGTIGLLIVALALAKATT